MKKFTALALICALITAAAGCGGDTAPAPVNTPAVSDSTPAATEASASDEAPATSEEASSEEEAAETTAAEKPAIPADSEYVIENGITDRMKVLSELVTGNKARLAKVFKKAQNGEEITVAYLGGSITQGSSAGNDLCYAKLTTDWLKTTFPNAKINYVNAGIGATGSYIGVYRTDRDVLCHEPDLVFIDFSVNDTYEYKDRNIASYDGVLQKIWKSPSSPAIVTIAMTQENGTSFQEYHSEICEFYDIPMISYREAILDVIKNGHIVWTDISDDDIHPNVTGHAVLTEIITSYLQGVLDEIDSIDTANESDFSKAYSSDKYSTAGLIVPETDEPIEHEGWETILDKFGNFGGQWRYKSKDGTFTPLTFEVEAKSIGIFYGKLITAAPLIDVFVDGELCKTIDARFPGGWGSYVEAEEVVEFDTCGTHKVEMIPRSDGKSVAVISAIAITK